MTMHHTAWTPSDLGRLFAPEILNTLADGAYITDTERRIIFWNDAAEQITGWTATDVVGRSCSDNILVHRDKDDHALCGREFCPLHRSMVTGTRSSRPMLLYAQAKDGRRIPVEVTVAPLRDRDGTVVGGIELFRDLTENERDLIRARQIQQLELRCDIPEDERVAFDILYTPIDIVGGDFYRVEQTDPDHYAMIVADVMGHGVAAALYTMQLRSLWEDWRDELRDPAAFLGRLHGRLHALTNDASYFATAVCALYNAVTGDLRYVLAGHPSPLLIRADGQFDTLDKHQPPLGMFPDCRYTAESARLSAGDSLVMLTDGALEVANTEDVDLGRDGLEQVWREEINGSQPSAVSLSRIEERLLQYSNRIHLADDLTLVRLTRRA